jgi:hypothetical protein
MDRTTEQVRLDALADVVFASIAGTGFGPRTGLVHVANASEQPDAGDFGYLDLAGDNPIDRLLGTTAPPGWWALGIVCGGWVADLATPAPRPSADPDAVRMQMVLLVARSGAVASRLQTADGRVIHDPPDGPGIDALRRALGQGTPPPSAPVGELFTVLWLTDIVGACDEGQRRGRRPTWNQLARLHPALRQRRGGQRPSVVELGAAAEALTGAITWADVRRQCIDQAWLSSVVMPAHARWMDEGMLSRWLFANLPRLPYLFDQLRPRLREEVWATLTAALRDLGVEIEEAA